MENHDLCPTCNRQSRSVKAIVASETTHGSWHGSAGLVGIGNEGLAFGAASMSGNHTSQSLRAQEFMAPRPEAVHEASVGFRRLMTGLMGLFMLVLLGKVAFPFIDDAGSTTYYLGGDSSGPRHELQELAIWLGGAGFLLLAVFGLVYMVIKAYEPEANRQFKQAKARDRRRDRIYSRLRYCEYDHIVFDPVTRAEAPATERRINVLINSIADRS
jgi:hypothetical protein